MADARIVYEGAAGGGGDLFAGKVFFLSQRVPFRNTYKGYIESNGGTITQIEKQADMLIADHARKDPPIGSISWKWIEDSVKHGRLENIEEYRAGPAEPQIREVGSGQPTRKGRVKFTAEDDKILIEWCTRAERQGQSLGGNKIYDQLALKHPRHTSQSWRDHWRTQLAHLKRPELLDDDEDDEEQEQDDPVPVPPQPRQPQNRRSDPQPTPRPAPPPVRRAQSAISSSLPARRIVASPTRSERSHDSSLSKSFEANPHILKSAGGNVFTDEETQLLLDAYDSIMDISDDQALDAWIAWSIAHPNHTPQEWRNYFTEYVVPTNKAQTVPKKKQKQVKDTSPIESDLEEETAKPSGSKRETDKPTEIKDSQGSSGQTILSPTTRKAVDPCLIDVKEFENSLLLVADSLDLEVNFNPVICGRTLPLFTLWQVVQSDEFGGYDAVTGQKQWQKVATKLNFHPYRDRTAASDLRACYSEILADFEGARRDFLEEDGISGSQEEELINEQLFQTVRQTESTNGEEQDMEEDQQEYEELSEEVEEQEEELLREYEEHDDDLNSAQISPRRPRLLSPSAGKRRFGVDRKTQHIPYSKRQRIDTGKDREIPSTPEDVINNNQTTRPSQQPLPLKFAEPPSDSEDSPLREIRPIKFTRARPAARKPVPLLEPETQDFHYSQSPQYPPPPEESIDDYDENSLFTPRRQPPAQDLDDEEVEDIVLIRQNSPPASRRSPERRNLSTATTRGSLHSSSNNYESSTQSQTESQSQAELLAFIDKHVSDGYPQEIVIEALEATGMAIKDALTVMDSLADGDGIPEGIPGVWTKSDDQALEGGKGTAEYQRVVRKHGISRIGARKRYLMDVKRAQEELEDE